MKTVRRLTAIILAAIAVGFGFTFVGALNRGEGRRKISMCEVCGLRESPKTLEGVDLQELSDRVERGVLRCDAEVDIQSLRIPVPDENHTENMYAISEMVQDMPLAFCVEEMSFSYDTNDKIITKILLGYRYEKEICFAKIAEFKEKAAALVSDIKDSDALTETEKALLLHDRLALLCEYDQTAAAASVPDSMEPFTAYAALISGKAVCQGYSTAYLYMLRLLNIPCRICKSGALCHSWNIVTIENTEYHVDVTWDDLKWIDTDWDIEGEVDHNFFLLSSAALAERRRDSEADYDTSPADTTYDDYYWKSSHTAFQFAGGKLYYIDNAAETLKCASDDSELCSVEDLWHASETEVWSGNYSRLGGDGEKLYFSKTDAIYEIDPAIGTPRVIHTPELAEGSYRCIYGFSFNDGWLVYDVNDSPNFKAPTMERFRVLPDNAVPTLLISVTNNADLKQKVSVTAEEGFTPRGFYWGTSENSAENGFYEWKNQAVTVDLTVTRPGTYYLTVPGADEAPLETRSFTFYGTVLNAEGGSVSPESLLTLSGETLALPEPEKLSCVFEGWFTERAGGANAGGMAASGNLTLYARYRLKGNVNGDEFVDNIDAWQILYYESGLGSGTEPMLALGDVNADGRVDNLDAMCILKFDAGVLPNL